MTDTPRLDLDFVRRQFPAAVWEWAFFENAGGSFVPQSVVQRVTDYMSRNQVQPGASYGTSARAADLMADGQARIAAMINADVKEVIVGPSTTVNIYVLAQALKPLFAEGDEIVVTNLDHEANNTPWRRLADDGIVVREWRIDGETAELDPADLAGLLNERTRLVSFPHTSNLVGGINDVAAITRMVHDAGAMVCVDGVAYAPHRAIDVKALDVDFYAFSTYKVFGPHLGVLYGKRERLLAARGQNHFFFAEDDIPLKLNPGGPNHELTAALSGVADYLDALYDHHFDEPENDAAARMKSLFRVIAAHEETLATRFVDFLGSKPTVRLIGRATGKAEERAPTFSFIIDGMKPADLPPLLEDARVAIRSGHFYAPRLIEALGLDPANGVVRASMAHYNTLDEVDRLIAALDKAI